MNVRPGIYLRGDVDYSSIVAINFSTLKHMAKSPRHYQHALKHGVVETSSMGRGTAAHIAALEPERFATDYAIFQGARRAGKAWEEFEAAALEAGKKVLKQAQLDEALAIRDSVRSDETASALLSGGHAEVTLVWEDEETGLLCKGRVDFLRNDNVVSDLKITADIEQWAFAKACARLQNHVQAAMYHDAVAQLTRRPARFKLIATEAKAPHDVVVYPVDEETLGIGRDAYRAMLKRVAECRNDGHWPGHANGMEMPPLRLPKWTTGDTEDDLAALGLE